MTYLLDTNTISYFVRSEPGVLTRLKSTRPRLLAVSSVTVMELEYRLQRNPERARKLRPVPGGFLNDTSTLLYGEAEAKATAAIWANLEKRGEPIGAYDALIAGAPSAGG